MIEFYFQNKIKLLNEKANHSILPYKMDNIQIHILHS